MEPNYDNQESGSKKTLWIIGGIVLVIMVVGLVYGATQKTIKNSGGVQAPSASLNAPSINSTGSDALVLGTSETIETPVSITGMDVVNLQTFPQKVQARVMYTLQGKCSVLDTPTVSHSGKIFTISLTARAAKDTSCEPTAVSGNVVIDIPVADLLAGTYSVKIAKFTKSFIFKQDNQVQYTSDK